MLTVADHDPLTFAVLRREHPRLWPNHRRLVRLAHDDDAQTLAELDAELEILTARRRACVERLRTYRRRLYPGMRNRHHRRTRLAHDPPMPPAPADATPVGGLELRRLSVSILEAHGAVSLRELQGLIHRYGYRLASDRPVQRLADAMAYEVRNGRAERVDRGVYGPLRTTSPTTPAVRAESSASTAAGLAPSLLPWGTDPDEPTPVPVDPDLQDDPERWSAGAWPSSAHPGGDWCDGPPDPSVHSFIGDLDVVVAATRQRLADHVSEVTEDRRRADILATHQLFTEDTYEGPSRFSDDEYDADDERSDDELPHDELPPAPLGDDSSTNRSPGGESGPAHDGGRMGPDPRGGSSGSAAEGSELGDDLG